MIAIQLRWKPEVFPRIIDPQQGLNNRPLL
jgi:hypothetical protein